MICHCRLIFGKKYTILVSDVDNGGDYACVGTGNIWKISILPSQFCWKLKTVLKMTYLKKISHHEKQNNKNNWPLYSALFLFCETPFLRQWVLLSEHGKDVWMSQGQSWLRTWDVILPDCYNNCIFLRSQFWKNQSEGPCD